MCCRSGFSIQRATDGETHLEAGHPGYTLARFSRYMLMASRMDFRALFRSPAAS